jgi:hypothetical protein
MFRRIGGLSTLWNLIFSLGFEITYPANAWCLTSRKLRYSVDISLQPRTLKFLQRWSIALLVVAVLFLIFREPAMLEGTIKGPDGHVVSDAVVLAADRQGHVAARTLSSEKGEYSMKVPEGSYDISVLVPCCQYGSTKREAIRLESGEAQQVNIALPWGMSLGAEGDDPIQLAKEMRGRGMDNFGPVPRTASGKPDLSGVWINEFNPNMGGPMLQPWAEKIREQRTAQDSVDYPGAFCLPSNPAPIARSYPYKIVQTEDLVVILYEAEVPGMRQIFLDGRKHPSPDTNPTWQGHSIGHWEGDTLVVDITNYNSLAWLTIGGAPHTEALHTVEHIRRLDLGHLEVEITMNDPGAFIAPWTRKFTATLAPKGEEVMEYVCNENNRDVAHYSKAAAAAKPRR